MKKNKNHYLIYFFLVICIISMLMYLYAYQDHRNISSENPDFEMSAKNLISEFEIDLNKANKIYSDKTISIYGEVTSLDLSNKSISINDKVIVEIVNIQKFNFNIGDTLNVKGRFVGYDELFNELKIDQGNIFTK
jgi:hypothetical protein